MVMLLCNALAWHHLAVIKREDEALGGQGRIVNIKNCETLAERKQVQEGAGAVVGEL